MVPNTLRIVLVGISDKKDDAYSSTNEMYLDCEAFLAIHRAISPEVFKSISTCKSAHEVWIKLEYIYGGSNLDEDGIMMKELVDELFTLFDLKESTTTLISDCLHTSASSISQGNDMVSEEIYVDENGITSLDTSISSTTHSVNYCVDRSCISPKDSLTNVCGDMPASSCPLDQNSLFLPSCSMTNHLGEIKKYEVLLANEESDSPKESSSTPPVHMWLMARGNNEVSSSVCNNDDICDEDDDDDLTENIYVISKILHEAKNNSLQRFQDVLAYFENCNDSLSHEQDKSEQLEHELEKSHQACRDLRSSKEEIEVAHDKLKRDFEENVELRAQLDLLTSNYGKLEVNHEMLTNSHADLLTSHNVQKLAHEAIITKVTSSEPHVDNDTTSSQSTIFPCASPRNPSTHNVATSCDELLSLPFCSNIEAYTSSSTCIDTNRAEEIEELKAQVTSLKKDLEQCHEGMSTLNTVLCEETAPNDKNEFGVNSNKTKKGLEQVKNSTKIICFKCKVKGHHVRSCPLKTKSQSHKQQGKRPQTQSHIQLQVEGRPLPNKTQANTPQGEKSTGKKTKGRCCYLCRAKGHVASSCTRGNLSNPITIDNTYSLGKDKVGNVFAKFVGTQNGVKKRTIWVAKPIVINLLGPNAVGDQQAQT
ncbi:hypothetical protein D1007_38483 [Hordeum vulgare]|nr:hypothetical protein D1007_38483 [Hordeum vulgare]